MGKYVESEHYFRRRGLAAYGKQKDRCYNPKNRDYKWYGAKGIKVLYEKKEFVDWYVRERKNYVGKNPSIGRLDHNGHYSFENIRMESMHENRIEMRARNDGNKKKKKKMGLFSKKTGECIATFDSIHDCVRELDVSLTMVKNACAKFRKFGVPMDSQPYSWYYRHI